uniref:Uncharacterized protein n=1 Tax=Streptomyces sp. F2 TaxID=317660 RepID=V9Z849_9ACTN|nr:hypothetical protein [Streptomyces sp. F2]AHE39576.1 Hypothetical protein pFRL4_343c [Streptomyces sp. F2]
MAWHDRIPADAISTYPQLRSLTKAEGEEYLQERRAAWTSYERMNVDRRFAQIARLKPLRGRRVHYGSDLRSAEERRLRRQLKHRHGWRGFPWEHPCRWYQRSAQFTADLQEFAQALAVRWQVDRRELGQRERDHLLMEALDALDWPDQPGGVEKLASYLNSYPFHLKGVIDGALERHDDMLDNESCPRCCGLRDDNAPHRVYIAHYHGLGLYKVGVTTMGSNRRLVTHESAGATIVDTFTTANYPDALRLERAVLDVVSEWRTSNPLVTGGGEVWSDEARLIRLADFVERGMK